MQNTIEFDVPGIGHFKAYKEPPVAQFFFDRRAELAKLLGGRTELLKLEGTVRVWGASPDALEKEIAHSSAVEIVRANALLSLRECLVEVPKGFRLEGMGSDEFDQVYSVFESVRRPFRSEDEAQGAEAPKTVPAA